MQQHMKKLFLGTIFCLALVAAFVGQSRAAQQEAELVVSVDAKQRPLKDVLTEISKQLYWKISVDERLIDKPISGVYKDIEFKSFLKRALKGENLIVLYDEPARSINIRSFNGTSKMVAIEPGPNPLPDMKKMQAISKEERRKYAKYLADPNSIEPLSGKTLGEIEAIRDKEQKAYDAYLSNPDSIEPISGLKLSEIKAAQDKAQKAHDAYVSNPDSIEPISGLKLSEIKAAQDKSQKAHDAYVSNPDSVDPITGKTLGEIEVLRNMAAKPDGAKTDNVESEKPDSNTL